MRADSSAPLNEDIIIDLSMPIMTTTRNSISVNLVAYILINSQVFQIQFLRIALPKQVLNF
jgi:hypothetical protein